MLLVEIAKYIEVFVRTVGPTRYLTWSPVIQLSRAFCVLGPAAINKYVRVHGGCCLPLAVFCLPFQLVTIPGFQANHYVCIHPQATPRYLSYLEKCGNTKKNKKTPKLEIAKLSFASELCLMV